MGPPEPADLGTRHIRYGIRRGVMEAVIGRPALGSTRAIGQGKKGQDVSYKRMQSQRPMR